MCTYAFVIANMRDLNGESVPDLTSGLVEDAQKLVRLEIALARQEVKELAVQNGVAAGMLAAAGLLAMLAVLVAVPVLLVVALPWHWQAAVVWIVLYLVAAGVLALVGRSRLRLQPPRRTIESLKETKEWALHQVRSRGR
jgi:VIT1/CCC1 family predicted Fe2+/Mn2+ transporter